MKKIFLFYVFLIFLTFASSQVGAAGTKWESLDKGLEYASIRVTPGIIHAVRVDPSRYKFGVVTAKGLGLRNASVKSMARKNGAVVAINGGFFTPEYDSLGLLIDNGKVINPLKETSWWSVFFMKSGIPYIVHTNRFRSDPSISMAVQSGPRLLVNGHVPKLKPSIAERSTICITGKKDVVLIATENLLIQPKELTEYLRKGETQGGLGCQTALNLDGGSSTQMYARVGSFKLDVPGINKVANAVVVYPK